MKRLKAEPDTGSGPTLPGSTPPSGPAGPSAPSNIPPGFGQTLLGQLDITRLPIHHIVDIIFETLAANNVPHLFHSFLVCGLQQRLAALTIVELEPMDH
jgi:hypothetical protein